MLFIGFFSTLTFWKTMIDKTAKNAYEFKLEFWKIGIESELREVFENVDVCTYDKNIHIKSYNKHLAITFQVIFRQSYKTLSECDFSDMSFDFVLVNHRSQNLDSKKAKLRSFLETLKSDLFKTQLEDFKKCEYDKNLCDAEYLKFLLKVADDPTEQNERDAKWRQSELDLSRRKFEKSLDILYKTLLKNLKK